jgi:hypothetical protein
MDSLRNISRFTLIELLLVIAILAAMLFPALANATTSAKRVACKSNIKQMGIEFMLYEDDYEGWLPNWHDVKDVPWKNRHATRLFDYGGKLWIVGGCHLDNDTYFLEKP